MTTLDDVTIGHILLTVLLVAVIIATSVRVIATSRILKQRHSPNKQARNEQEEMPVSQ